MSFLSAPSKAEEKTSAGVLGPVCFVLTFALGSNVRAGTGAGPIASARGGCFSSEPALHKASHKQSYPIASTSWIGDVVSITFWIKKMRSGGMRLNGIPN